MASLLLLSKADFVIFVGHGKGQFPRGVGRPKQQVGERIAWKMDEAAKT